jgi:hypothetical protein
MKPRIAPSPTGAAMQADLQESLKGAAGGDVGAVIGESRHPRCGVAVTSRRPALAR